MIKVSQFFINIYLGNMTANSAVSYEHRTKTVTICVKLCIVLYDSSVFQLEKRVKIYPRLKANVKSTVVQK